MRPTAKAAAIGTRWCTGGHTQLSTTTRYVHHAPQRLVQTAATAERAWNLLPAPEPADHPV